MFILTNIYQCGLVVQKVHQHHGSSWIMGAKASPPASFPPASAEPEAQPGIVDFNYAHSMPGNFCLSMENIDQRNPTAEL